MTLLRPTDRYLAALVVFALIVICAVCSGCMKDVSRAERDGNTVRVAGTYSVYEIALEDGTRCVVFTAGGGITCDWQRKAGGK